MQELTNKYNINLFCLYGIVAHGEVDHVRGVAKISICREIPSGNPLQDATDMVEFLKTKFCDKTNPLHNVKEIDESKVEALQAKMRLKKICSIEGSASFQVLHFKLNCDVFSAAPYLCTCDVCWWIMDHVIYFPITQLIFIS